MSIEEQILEELRQLNQNFRDMFAGHQTAKVPEASRLLKVGAATLRRWCKERLIPCTPMNETSKSPQYLIDIPGARKAIANNAFLQRYLRRAQETKPRRRRTMIDLSKPA